MYYLRTRPAANAIQFTVDHGVIQQAKNQQNKSSQSTAAVANGNKPDQEEQEQAMACSLQNKEACLMCSA